MVCVEHSSVAFIAAFDTAILLGNRFARTTDKQYIQMQLNIITAILSTKRWEIWNSERKHMHHWTGHSEHRKFGTLKREAFSFVVYDLYNQAGLVVRLSQR